MSAKRALVVDDSKSARAFLARMLERYDIEVDTAESAEQAIDFLTRERPDVIFMDHLMPGMDGFQAVQTIKNNPQTATIPIMMYTSQEGELYLGQARALGAIGVLPKQIKPTDVSKVLYDLKLVADRRTGEGSAFTPFTVVAPADEAGDSPQHATDQLTEESGKTSELAALVAAEHPPYTPLSPFGPEIRALIENTIRAELADMVARLHEAGVTKVFVPAGDADPPAGNYPGALSLLEDLAALDHPFTHVGITGYPESHPSIDDDVTIQSMWDKRKYSTHVISNMTFDAEQIGTWAERLRRRGITLPLIVGVPGPVERTKLLGMASKIGVGESLRFLRKQKSVFARIAAPGFSTDRFVQRIAALKDNDLLGIEGLHLFTFNQVEVVETWRQRMLSEMGI